MCVHGSVAALVIPRRKGGGALGRVRACCHRGPGDMASVSLSCECSILLSADMYAFTACALVLQRAPRSHTLVMAWHASLSGLTPPSHTTVTAWHACPFAAPYSMHRSRHGLLNGLACICMFCMHVCGPLEHTNWDAIVWTALQKIAIIVPTLRHPVQMPSRAVASAAVVLMGLVWASVGLALLIATEYLESPAAKCAWHSCACK